MLPPPFDPTGWKTVWLDHITYQCTDYKKAAAFYSALMGWKVRSDDGKQAVIDIGDDVGGFIMTNGFVAAAAAAGPGCNNRRQRRAAGVADAAAAAHARRAWRRSRISAGASSRGIRRRSKRNSTSAASIPSPITPVDFKSFHIKDPDGFDIQVSNGTKANRRKGAANGKAPGAGAVRADGMENGLARPPLVRLLRLQTHGRVL